MDGEADARTASGEVAAAAASNMVRVRGRIGTCRGATEKHK
jgi:hypothetical protein